MDFEPGKVGVLAEAFALVNSELPPSISDEVRSKLAVEVYKAWLLADASGRIASNISGLTMSLDALGLSRQSL